MSPPTRDRRELVRFSLAVRLVHAATAALLIVCIATAAVLYNGSLAVFFGDRYVVEQIHVWSGFALPVPLLLGLLSRTYRLDLGRLNRFTSLDWRWLRSRRRREGSIPVGKFNAGQKLNGALSAGAIGALLASGTVMYFTNVFRLSWRSGATFVHDWFALGLGLLVVGHILYALRDPDAMKSMRTGRVPLRWARREHGAWAEELVGVEPGLDEDLLER
jgi:formate dehydrogenase subunit gamma